VTYVPTSPQLMLNGPTVAGAVLTPHRVSPADCGSPAASPTQISYTARYCRQQSERPYTSTDDTYDLAASCTDSHGFVSRLAVWQKLQTAWPPPHTPSMHALPEKS